VRRVLVALLLMMGCAELASAQVIPRLPGMRPGQGAQQQPVRRDTLADSLRPQLPPPDSITQRLMNKAGYSVTRYSGDTAFFNEQRKSLDLLAGNKKRPAIVDRDSTRFVSDSGIYYTQGNSHVTSGGNYVITPPASSNQAEIRSIHPGRVEYDLGQRSLRINNASLPVNNGDVWYLTVKTARIDVDTAGAQGSTVAIGGGTMTTCDDSIPDYTFAYKEAKRTGSNTLVARDVTMKIKDIPIAWFPFIFSDTRSGRHSGLLPPQFGLGDIVRNSPTYRRNVEHLGYYWAPSDYYDFSTWLDWRSAAGSVQGDPGWVRLNGDWNYKWLDRFLGGRVGASYTKQNDGQSNTAVSWTHQEDFGRNNHINTNVNYVTSTTLQRQNTFNPYAALATIASQVAYQSKIGPASLNVGATRKQYPGRQQVDQGIPSITFSTTPLSLGKNFSWNPGFSFNRNDVLQMDQPGIGQYVYSTNAQGGRDSTLAKNRSSSTATATFDTPITIFGWTLGNSFRLNQQRNNFPQQFNIYDVETGAQIDQRIYSATYRSDLDWTPTFTLPSLGQNRFNLTPSVSLANIDPGPMWVASERTNGKYVSQGKRISFGLSASPTLFAFFPGFGPLQRIRHSITPSFSWSGAPAATVSDEYLKALGRTRQGYLGSLRQNQLSLGLNQVFEAKLGSRNDTLSEKPADKVRLLTINISPISYDFERAADARTNRNNHNWWAGVSTDNLNYSLNSELLPGFDFSGSYSLFQGSTLSDTAVFKPYLTSISASFNVSRDQNPFAVLARIFGKPVPEPAKAPDPGSNQVRQRPDSSLAQQLSAQPVAGSARGGDRFIVPPTQGWKASFAFSRSSPRPPTGSGVIQYDPRTRCQAQVGNDPFLLQACIDAQRAAPTNEVPVTSATAGAQLYAIPPTTSVNSDLSFNLTTHWAAHWTTTYDVEHHEFASHIVQLQRELHDWRAIFGFTQSPNGNFAFNFMIALKAEPDIKFDYNKATVRSGQPF
jgi:hypothetical protein